MVYHRLDSAAGSSDSRREADKSWGNRDSSADNASDPVRYSGDSSRPDDSVEDSDVGRISEETRGNEGKYTDSYEGRHSNYDGRYGDNSRSRNGRDEGSRYSKTSRSRDDDRYSRSRDDRREGFRDKDRYDSPRHSDRSRHRESSRYDRHDEGSRRSEGSRYSDRASDRSRHNEDSDHGDSRYNESSRYQDDSRHSESSRYSESSRHRSRSEHWYGREGRYGGSRYDDARYGESSRHWREGDQESAPEDSIAAFNEPEQEKARNVFQNDGSFLEMFKKMQEANKPPANQEEGEPSDTTAPVPATKEQQVVTENVSVIPKRPLSIVGKRRGGRVLPTGMVKKQKREEEVEETPKDAWSLYIAEVRKYKEASCEEEGKTRPLVK